MKTKIPVLMVLFIATVLMFSTAASAATSSRLHASSVSPGEQFVVTVNVDDYGMFGKLVETIPAGFTFDGSAATFDQSGQTVTFFLFGDDSVQYTVTASGSEGIYQFNGELFDEDKAPTGVPAATSVTVESDGTTDPVDPVDPVDPPVDNGASATRDMPATVEPGEVFTVSMTASDYGTFGNIVEELPNGFSFVGSTLDEPQVVPNAANGTVMFLLFGDSSFEYTVMASATEGAYIFDGDIQDEDKNSTAVSGDTLITVDTFSASTASATRDLPASVEPGEVFTVSMTASDYGTIGNIVEALPAGFTFVGSTLDPIQVVPGTDSVMFLLLNDASFEYTVMAPATEGTYQFSGIIEDEDKNTPVVVLGDVAINVEVDGVVTPPTPDENVSLDMGWNFISVPFALENSSAANVLEGVSYDALTYYNAASGTWGPVTDFEPLKGYWIHVIAADQCIMASALEPAVPAPDTPSFPLSMPVYEGWNAIGFTDETTCLSAELTLITIDESYSNIWGAWDPATNSYEYFGHNGQSGVIGGNHVGTDIFEMCPYKGYWVYMTQDDVLSAAS